MMGIVPVFIGELLWEGCAHRTRSGKIKDKLLNLYWITLTLNK